MTITALISEYRLHAIEHGAATETGDHKNANKHHDRLMAVLHLLREWDAEGDRALLDLLSEENASIRCWAATHCLNIDERQARRTLEAVSGLPGILGFNAQMTLSEWEKGTLDIP